jgi:hypothetical protein
MFSYIYRKHTRLCIKNKNKFCNLCVLLYELLECVFLSFLVVVAMLVMLNVVCFIIVEKSLLLSIKLPVSKTINVFLFRKLFVEEFLRFRHLRRQNLHRRSPVTSRNPFYSLKITAKPIKYNQCARTQFYFTPCMYSKAAINMHLFNLFKILQQYLDLPAVPQEVRSPTVVFALS